MARCLEHVLIRRSHPWQEWVEELEKDANVGHACLLACRLQQLPFMLREQPSVAGITGTIIPPLLLCAAATRFGIRTLSMDCLHVARNRLKAGSDCLSECGNTMLYTSFEYQGRLIILNQCLVLLSQPEHPPNINTTAGATTASSSAASCQCQSSAAATRASHSACRKSWG